MPTPLLETVKMDELDCWRIRHNGAEVLVAQQGAHVFSYQPADAKPVIWPNDKAVFKQGKGIRTGVPVCWPWFGVFERNPQSVKAMRQSDQPAGAHGFARTAIWTLVGVQDNRVELALIAPAGGFPGWPHQVDLKMSLLLDDQLHIHLTSHNRGTDTVTISQALHSYFAVSDVRSVRVEGVDGLDYIETLADWEQRPQQSDLTFSGETDRIYLDSPAQLSIVDPAWNRRVRLTSGGSRSAVIWNPWTERAAQLPDMAADGWQRMLCIETANAWDDLVELAPGATHVLSLSISSESL